MDLLEVGSQVRDVTVFRQGAEVTRVAELAQVDGRYPEWVQIGMLPLTTEDDSLRARVVALGKGAAPLAADLRVELQVITTGEIPSLSDEDQERLRELDRQEQGLIARADFLKRSFEKLASLEPRPRPTHGQDPPMEGPVEPRRKLIKFRQRELTRLHTQGRELDAQLQELARERQALRPPAPNVSGEVAKRVVVRLKTPQGAAPRARLELTYRTTGARWAPAYAFRLDRDLTMADVLMRVVVCQATGEDWKRVRLSVSTADPVAWKDLPELPSWRIGKRQPAPARTGWRPAPTGTETLFVDFDRARKTAPEVVTPPPPLPEPSGDPFGGNDPFASVSVDPFGAPSADPFGTAPAADPFVSMDAEWLGSDPFAVPATESTVRSGLMCDSAPAPSARPALMARMGVAATSRTRSGLMKGGSGEAKPSMSAGGAPKSPSGKPMLVREQVREQVGPPMRSEVRRPDYLGATSWSSHAPPYLDHLEVGSEHLTYSSLRMPGPEEPVRGRLRPYDPIEGALELLRKRGHEAFVNLRGALQDAARRAQAVSHMKVLPGHRAPVAVEGFDYLYGGDGLVDIPGDGQFHSLPLLVKSLPARAEYITVPRVTSEVYRIVELESLPDLALPQGPADVYVGDDFLIGTELPDTPPGGTIRLGLGVEQQVKVARNTSFTEGTAGMMGGTAQLRHTVTIELNNRLDREARLQVQERLPEPAKGQDEIKIKVEEVSPQWESFKPAERPDFTSAYRWLVKVEARSRMTLKVTYLIEIPSKLELQGGNRREA